MSTFECLHCHAELTERDIHEGTCAVCEKVIPRWILQDARSARKHGTLEAAPATSPTAESPVLSAPGASWLINSVGAVNLAWGLLLLALGIYIMVAGADAVAKVFQVQETAGKAAKGLPAIKDQAKELNAALNVGAKGFGAWMMGLALVLAGCMIVQGLPLVLVGLGVWYRKNWARVFALIFAVLAGLQGLALLMGAGQSKWFLLYGFLFLGYSVLTFVALIGKRAAFEFSGGLKADPFSMQHASVATFHESAPLGSVQVPAQPQSPPTPFNQAPRLAETPVLSPRRSSFAVTLFSAGMGVVIGAAGVFAFFYFTGAKPALGTNKAADKIDERTLLLLDAADKGLVNRVVALIKEGVDVDAPDENGETALMKAAAKGQLRVATALVAHGAQVNQSDHQGATPLMRAAAQGHGAMIDILSGAPGAWAEIANFRAELREPVKIAVPDLAKGLPQPKEWLQALVAQKLDVDVKNREGQTALFLALVNGHLTVIAKLRALGSQEGLLVDRKGDTVLHKIAANGNALLCEQCLRRESNFQFNYGYSSQPPSNIVLWDQPNLNGMEAWMIAAEKGHLSILKRLLPSPPAPERLLLKNKDGKTAYELAADNGHRPVVDLLREHLKDSAPKVVVKDDVPKIVAKDKESAANKEKRVLPNEKVAPAELIQVAEAGDHEAITQMIVSKREVLGSDAQGRTALMVAAGKGHLKVVLLLTHHATKNPEYFQLRDQEGKSALAHAAAAGHAAVVEALLHTLNIQWHAGQVNWFVFLELKDKSGKNAMALAKDHKEAAALIQVHYTSQLDIRSNTYVRSALEQAAQVGDLPTVEALLARKASLVRHANSLDHKNVLMYAAESGHILIVQAILDSFGKDHDARRKYIEEQINLPGIGMRNVHHFTASSPEIAALIARYAGLK